PARRPHPGERRRLRAALYRLARPATGALPGDGRTSRTAGRRPRYGGIMNCARKHTLVTGCSSGIGRSTALRLARDGQHVYAGIRQPADGDRLARSAAGGEITPVILDVTEPGHIAAAAATIDEHTGAAGLDGLVNNAGYGLACPAELVPLDSFRRQLDVNVTGQLAVTQAMLPALRRARGRIVMVSTIGVRFSPPFAGPLDAAKAAADPGARALYEGAFGAMLQVMERREANGSPPDVAAATITKALTARRPKAVYLSGKDSRRLAILSGLPVPVLDMARRRVFRLPAPGSLAS